MGDEFTPEIQKAWECALNTFAGLMICDNYEPQEITSDHIQIVTEAWNNLLKKGELNIGRVLYKNIF
jgi:hypothetical protein